MNPVTTKISGFGPHSDTEIAWSELDSVVGIVGENGGGKTMLVEAGFAALYGEFPSRPGRDSLYRCLTQGGSGKGEIYFAFNHEGTKYEAIREVSATEKTRTTSALLYEEGNDSPIAGPKVSNFDAKVTSLLGSKDAAQATWFSSQGARGDLTTALPSERRAMFGEFLGFERLDQIADKAKGMASRAESKIEVLTHQLNDLPDFESEIEVETSALKKTEKRLAGLKKSEQKTEDLLSEAESELQELSLEKERYNQQNSRLESIKEKLDSLREQKSTAERDLARLEEYTSGGTEAAEDDVAKLSALRDHLKKLRVDLEQHNRHEKWIADRDRIKGLLDNQAESGQALRSLVQVDDETRTLAQRLPVIKEDLDKARGTQREIQKLEVEISAASKSLIKLKERSAPETPADDEVCATCPLFKEFADIPRLVEDKQDDISSLEQKRDEIREDAADVDEIEQSYLRAKSAADEVGRAKEKAPELEAARTKYREIQTQLQSHLDAEPDQGSDRTKEIEETTDEIERLEGAKERLESIKRYLAEKKETASAITRLVGSISDTSDEYDEQLKTVSDLRLSIDGYEDRVASLVQSSKEYRAKIKEIREESDEAKSDIGSARARIENLKDRYAQVKSQRADVKSLSERASHLRQLQRAFGRDGVQAILLDNAATGLEDIASDLLEKATDGRFQMTITTLVRNRDGSMREDFRILARDFRGERDVSEFSGGERKVFMTVLRIAIILWLARTSGYKTGTIFLDEAFDALDAANSDIMVNLFLELSDRFDRVVLVTHNHTIASRLLSKVHLEPTSSGVTVTTRSTKIAA